MNSQQILKSNLLDIVFENRNKLYGAYTLRKHYPGRLGLALSSTIAIAYLFITILKPSYSEVVNTILAPKDQVTITTVQIPVLPSLPLVEPVPSPSSYAAARQHTNIQIVSDAEAETNVPSIDHLTDNQISTETNDGLLNVQDPVQEKVRGDLNANQTSVAENNTKFDPVEIQPQFPGGSQAWTAFLQRHLRVPEELEPGSKKTVLVRFLVSVDGSITKFEIVQSGGQVFDNEVIRVLKKMPRWNPAVQNGRTISLSFIQPVTFQTFEE